MSAPARSKTASGVNSLRLLFRHLLALRSLAESEGVYEITCPNGAVWSLFDIEYLYARAMRRPLKISGTLLPVQSIRVDHYIQHGGKWCRVVKIEEDPVKPIIYIDLLIPETPDPADRFKRKRFSSTAQVKLLSPHEKRLLDHDKLNPCLPRRQQQAIELFLIQNVLEEEAAVMMGVSPTNPVGMYATAGLERLLKLLDQELLHRFSIDDSNMLSLA